MFNKLFGNDKAVSPVVATLVLIVVAIIGAAAVGALLGAFGSSVQGQANSGNTAGATSQTLSVVGSTTVLPATQLLAKSYGKDHTGVTINPQGGGSGAGVAAVGNKIADIGATSRHLKPTEISTYPELLEYEIGAGATVFIINSGVTTSAPATQAELNALYTAGTAGTVAGAATITPFIRSDSSGTQDTVASWLGAYTATGPGSAPLSLKGTGVSGSQAMEDMVGSTANSIGFVDFGFAIADGKVHILPLTESYDVSGRKLLGSGGTVVTAPVAANVKNPYTGSAAQIAAQTRMAATAAGTAGQLWIGEDKTTATDNSDHADNVLKELKTIKYDKGNVGCYYPEGLLQPLQYITNGAPTTLQTDFIHYAQSPNGAISLNEANYFGYTQYA